MERRFACSMPGCTVHATGTSGRLPSRWTSVRDQPICPNHNAKARTKHVARQNRIAFARRAP